MPDSERAGRPQIGPLPEEDVVKPLSLEESNRRLMNVLDLVDAIPIRHRRSDSLEMPRMVSRFKHG